MSRVYTQHRCLYPYGFKLSFEVTRRQQPKYFQRQENILPGRSLLKQTNLVSYSVSLRTCLPMQEMEATQVWSLGWEGPLEKSMASHSTILAWRIPWTEEPGGLQSLGLQRVGRRAMISRQTGGKCGSPDQREEKEPGQNRLMVFVTLNYPFPITVFSGIEKTVSLWKDFFNFKTLWDNCSWNTCNTIWTNETQV